MVTRSFGFRDRKRPQRRNCVLVSSPGRLEEYTYATHRANSPQRFNSPLDCAPQLTAGSQSDSSDAGHESMADPHPPVYDFLASAVDF